LKNGLMKAFSEAVFIFAKIAGMPHAISCVRTHKSL